jgi:hypothetical protein
LRVRWRRKNDFSYKALPMLPTRTRAAIPASFGRPQRPYRLALYCLGPMNRRLAFLLSLSALTAIAQPAAPTVDPRERWNKVFTNPEAQINRHPNAFLQKTLEGRKPGRALDVGLGMLRNSLWLASRGWDVTGVDVADEGIRLPQETLYRTSCSRALGPHAGVRTQRVSGQGYVLCALSGWSQNHD